MSGIELIAAERKRQIEVEGWTERHDDGHTSAQMAFAGACYAQAAGQIVFAKVKTIRLKEIPSMWLWARKWWKPSPDPIRNLVKAGALIAAEIDRLERMKR